MVIANVISMVFPGSGGKYSLVVTTPKPARLDKSPGMFYMSMILPRYHGKIPQTSPKPAKKEIPKQKLVLKGPFGIFQGALWVRS